MKYLKSYKIFEKDEDQENINDIEDIFIHVKDLGLEVSDVYSGHSLSLGDKQIVTDHMEFSKIGPDGKFVDSFKSLNIRLKPYKKDNTLGSFNIDDEVYEELESAINHVESQFNCEFSNLYLRTPNGVWFSSISVMKEYINNLPFAKKQSLKWVSYLDLTFKVLGNISESVKSDSLGEILDDVKDIFRDLSDDIFDIYIKDGKVSSGNYKWYDISISIYKNRSGRINAAAENIYLYEIKDYIKRSIEYLESEGFKLISVIPYGAPPQEIDWEDIDNWNPNDIVMAMNIYFKEIK
jgi:hypothetical protein